jgi:competence protein ComEC
MAEDNTQQRSRVPPAPSRALALSSYGPGSLGFDGFAWRGWLERHLAQEVEQRRLFPWIAVCFGLGIVLYFQADGRPSLWAPLVGAGAFTGFAVMAHARPLPLAMMIGCAALFAGFAASVIRTRSVEAPVLSRIAVTPVTGYIEAVEGRPEGARLLLRLTSASGLERTERPRRIRVTVRSGSGLEAGQHVSATARLLPPPVPAWPGGYDFARDAFFRGIGAVGSLVGSVRATPPPEDADWWLALGARVDSARNALTDRIATVLGGPAGAVSAALVTGKRDLIEQSTNDVLRAAGIYHIVSISGLHMVLAAGAVFGLTRALLALAPESALLWPVKKIAAATAMLGATAYCVFSGAEVATERSLIMTLVMFGAILVDRPALSIRNCAIAALVVLARKPETLLGPSFQMSFGAVVALIACAGWLRLGGDGTPPASWLNRGVRWATRSAVGLIGMTCVASLATAPFAAYHFQTLTPLGLIGNALALPLVSLVVMPAGLLGVLAYPFGLDRPVWQIMGAAVTKVLEVSAWVSGLEGSSVVVPAMGAGALALLSMALLLMTLPVSSLRWFALVPAGAGFAMAAAPERYTIFVDRGGAGAAIRAPSGRLVLVGKPSGFVVEQWLRADGDSRTADDPGLREGAHCDRAGCIVRGAEGHHVAFVEAITAFEEDCRRAAVVITRLNAPPTCKAALVLDAAVLRSQGALAVRFSNGAFEVRSGSSGAERRPWAVKAPPRRAEDKFSRNRPPEGRPTRDEPDSALSTGEPG